MRVLRMQRAVRVVISVSVCRCRHCLHVFNHIVVVVVVSTSKGKFKTNIVSCDLCRNEMIDFFTGINFAQFSQSLNPHVRLVYVCIIAHAFESACFISCVLFL